MGKQTKKKSKQGKKAQLSTSLDGPSAANAGPKSKFSAEQLLNKAKEYLELMQFELALKFCKRATEVDSENCTAFEMLGSLCMELGDLDTARESFLRAVAISPASGHDKYMTLGQLVTSDDAVQYFLTGIDLMEKQKQLEENSAAASTVSADDICRGYCSLAELYLTDKCDEEDAEKECEKYLAKATAVSNTNPEAYQLQASFYLSKDDKQKAWEAMEKSLSLWYDDWKQQHASDEPISEVTSRPTYEGRMNAAKLLMELEKHEIACNILELMLDEDDEITEVWYLIGWGNYLQGTDYYTNARFYLQRALEVAKKMKFDDEDVLHHIDELLQTLGPEPEQPGDEEEAPAGDDADMSSGDEEDASDQHNGHGQSQGRSRSQPMEL